MPWVGLPEGWEEEQERWQEQPQEPQQWQQR